MTAAAARVTELRYDRAERRLHVAFEDGANYDFTAEFLRVVSPSAEVQGHSPAERKTVPGKRKVAISAIDPVGNYAVRLHFDDGHDTGLYSWSYLKRIGEECDAMWEDYLNRLSAEGGSRDHMF